MTGLIPLLSNGHGGMKGGKYQTPGKRSPDWQDGVFYEGAGNRWIVNSIIKELDYKRLPYYHICPEIRDVSVNAKVNRANKIYQSNRQVYGLEVHFNAGGGTGTEGYTSRGDTRADPIGELILSNWEIDFPEMNMRFDTQFDGDRDKEAGFGILTKTQCPFYIHEICFMDSSKDYSLLFDRSFHQRVVDSLVRSIEYLYHNGSG